MHTNLPKTPQELFSELDSEFHFDLDVCALPETAKCKNYFLEQESLFQPWIGVCWCDPPSGRSINDLVRMAMLSSDYYDTTIVMLLPAKTNAKWFYDYIYQKRNVEVRFLPMMVKFRNSKKKSPAMIAIFRRKFHRWIFKGREKGYFCSACGGGCLLNMESDWYASDYCPHCGAKMNINDDGR